MSGRLKAIVEQINVRPDDEVLEIGCGHGVAATFICERLRDGHLLAIDRSAKMIAAASVRNAEFVRSGKAEFTVADLEHLDLKDRKFDKVLAVRVGFFHREPRKAEAIVKKWLAPKGRIFSIYDEPGLI